MKKTRLYFGLALTLASTACTTEQDLGNHPDAGGTTSSGGGRSSSSSSGSSGSGTGGAASSSSSSSGSGSGCAGVQCTMPPAPTCASATTLRTSSSPGTCAAGACSYPYVDTVCPSGCSGGMCHVISNQVTLSAGADLTCALTSTFGIKCCGYNAYGEIGDGSTTDSHVPVDVMGLSSGVLEISAGYLYTCALTSTSGVKCWGINLNGQLGNNSTTDSHVPVDVVGLSSGVLAVSASKTNYHTCALTSTGGVKCWGKNTWGQLGDNSTTDSPVPVDVVGLSSGVLAVSAGSNHTCALTSAGAVKCWGWNGYGELGDNSKTLSHVPVDVVGLSSGVLAVSAGESETCAVTSAGAVKCWGSNDHGQLGNNSKTESHVPVDVVGLSSGVLAAAVNFGDACAVTSSGGVKCWGSNDHGQLGDNSTTDSPVPVDVVGLSSGVVGVTPGVFHTCAVTATGAVKCWGRNGYGQLGDGSTTESHVPVDAVGF